MITHGYVVFVENKSAVYTWLCSIRLVFVENLLINNFQNIFRLHKYKLLLKVYLLN